MAVLLYTGDIYIYWYCCLSNYMLYHVLLNLFLIMPTLCICLCFFRQMRWYTIYYFPFSWMILSDHFIHCIQYLHWIYFILFSVQVADNLLHDSSSNLETLIFCSQTLRSKVFPFGIWTYFTCFFSNWGSLFLRMHVCYRFLD